MKFLLGIALAVIFVFRVHPLQAQQQPAQSLPDAPSALLSPSAQKEGVKTPAFTKPTVRHLLPAPRIEELYPKLPEQPSAPVTALSFGNLDLKLEQKPNGHIKPNLRFTSKPPGSTSKTKKTTRTH